MELRFFFHVRTLKVVDSENFVTAIDFRISGKRRLKFFKFQSTPSRQFNLRTRGKMRCRTADGGARAVLALVLLKFDGLLVGGLAHREAGPARWSARDVSNLLALRGGAGEPPAAVRLTGITVRVTAPGGHLRARVCVCARICAQPSVFFLPWCLAACLRVPCKYYYM